MSFDAHDVARFWSKVDVLAEGNCWPWRAGTDKAGYGDFKVRTADRSHGAHRVAYAIFTGTNIDALEGLVVRHSCDTPACCNPFHLSTGTHIDNVMDRVERGRSAIGTGNGNHKLTETEVLSIYQDLRPNTEIARDFGVHTDTVRCIKIGKTWRHVTTPDHPKSPDNTNDPAGSCALSAP